MTSESDSFKLFSVRLFQSDMINLVDMQLVIDSYDNETVFLTNHHQVHFL